MSPTSISIVICTINRCEHLRNTLDAITQCRSDFIELIIVHGPSQDDTDIVLAEYEWLIDKVIVTVSKNVSTVRNLGLTAASGEIIIYLDDDVIPPPQWLESHRNFYMLHGQTCGCVAGAVRDKTKLEAPLQFSRGVNSLIGESRPILSERAAKKYTANPYWFSSVMGANASYRRDVLLQLGGFDDFFEYFLEETDICLRLIQSGYKIYYTDRVVDHYPGKSHNRQDQKHLTCWYSLAKNTTYFSLKHAFSKIPLPIFVIRLTGLLIYRCFLRILRLKFTHGLPKATIWKYLQESISGIRVGWVAGMKLHSVNISKEA